MDLLHRQMIICFVCSALAGATVYESVASEHKYSHLPHESYNTNTQTFISPASVGTAQTTSTSTSTTSTATTT